MLEFEIKKIRGVRVEKDTRARTNTTPLAHTHTTHIYHTHIHTHTEGKEGIAEQQL